MIPLGPLRLLPQVRAAMERRRETTESLTEIYEPIQISLPDCKWPLTSKRDETESECCGGGRRGKIITDYKVYCDHKRK